MLPTRMDKAQITYMIEILKGTARCRSEIKRAAQSFSSLGVEGYEALINSLVASGEDKALGILLNICAVNDVRLSPEILVKTLTVVEPVTDFVAPFRNQDHTIIAPLLAGAEALDISMQRMAIAARLAAELTVRFDQDPKPVRRVLMKHSKLPLNFEAGLLNSQSFALIDATEVPDDVPWLTTSDPMKMLPKNRPPVVIGGGYSVKRPIPKLGRNEPCHCGSGKKYKKCCIEKDQALLRDASPHEGVTMTELKSNPGLVDDLTVIEEMRAYDLKKLNPSDLISDQLLAAGRRADSFGLYDLAMAMFVELQNREDFDFDPGHFYDLMESALTAKDIDSARKIQACLPEDHGLDFTDTELRFALLENPKWLEMLEHRCRKALTNEKDDWETPLISTSYNLENIYPALSIVFARAAIMESIDSPLDQEGLLDTIQLARINLDMDPWQDPIEEFLDWSIEKKENVLENESQVKEIERLKNKVSETNELATQRLQELKEKELELQKLSAIQNKQTEKPHPAVKKSKKTAVAVASDQQTISKLRQRIENLKADISKGQQERRELRKQIQQTLAKVEEPATAPSNATTDEDPLTVDIPFEDNPKKILFPEFTAEYRNSCKTIDSTLVKKSLKAAMGFAAHDRLIWRQTKALSTLESIYSIRVGIHYRLLIYREKDVRLQVLDLIPRKQLETWIRGFRKKA